MTLGSIAGRKLFLPTQHLWLRATKLNVVSSATNINASRYPWLVDIGLSLRGLEDIGDVLEMRCTRSPPQHGSHTKHDEKEWLAKAGDDILAIDWDAHKITSADELYHTVWETFSETTYIKSPINGIIKEVRIISPDEEELDEDTVLVRVMAACETLQQSTENLLEEDDYQEFVGKDSPGKFESAGA